MGACCSVDSLPDVPEIIQPDPEANGSVTFKTRQLGGGRDYAVYKDAFPTNSADNVQKMWLWLNKSDGGN
jgi:hypothetical protein